MAQPQARFALQSAARKQRLLERRRQARLLQTQTFQDPLIKEYIVSHIRVPYHYYCCYYFYYYFRYTP